MLDNNTVMDLVEDVMSGTEDTLRPFSEIAAKHGLDAEKFSADVTEVREAFARQAEAVVREMNVGVEPEVVFQWAANRYDRGYLAEIQRRHYYDGNLSGYRALADAYIQRHPKEGTGG